MPHVAMVMQLRTMDITWRRLGQVARGADLLESQLGVNEIMQEMVSNDIAKIRNDYESQRHSVDPASDSSEEVTLALQVIQDYESKATSVIVSRQAAIRSALLEARAH